MKRCVLQLVTLFSLLGCTALALMWVRSYWAADGVAYGRPSFVLTFGYSRGTFAVHYERAGAGGVIRSRLRGFQLDSTNPFPWSVRHFGFIYFDRLGFAMARESVGRDDVFALLFPAWFATASAAGVAALAWRGLLGLDRLDRRRKAGLCAACGYDLRATPDKCPECGAAGNFPGDRARTANLATVLSPALLLATLVVRTRS